MFLESESFIVRDLEEKDKENIRAVEEVRPWASVMNGLKGIIDEIPDVEAPDLFEDLWNSYIFSITDFYIDLWDENDTSKPIYVEAGYDMEDGSLEINL